MRNSSMVAFVISAAVDSAIVDQKRTPDAHVTSTKLAGEDTVNYRDNDTSLGDIFLKNLQWPSKRKCRKCVVVQVQQAQAWERSPQWDANRESTTAHACLNQPYVLE